jgi:hypothetical protein
LQLQLYGSSYNVPPSCNNTQPTKFNLIPLILPTPLFPLASPKPSVPVNPQTTHSTTQQSKHVVNHQHRHCIIRSFKHATGYRAATPFCRISPFTAPLPGLPTPPISLISQTPCKVVPFGSSLHTSSLELWLMRYVFFVWSKKCKKKESLGRQVKLIKRKKKSVRCTSYRKKKKEIKNKKVT